jgi:internalin A
LRNVTIALFIVVVASFCILLSAAVIENGVIFPDPNLDKAIRGALNKPGGSIYTSDLGGLKSLNASSRGIKNLTGLENCTNLTKLDLSNNSITDVSPLSKLTQLNLLNLSENPITNVSGLLSGLTNLTELDLSDPQQFITITRTPNAS